MSDAPKKSGDKHDSEALWREVMELKGEVLQLRSDVAALRETPPLVPEIPAQKEGLSEWFEEEENLTSAEEEEIDRTIYEVAKVLREQPMIPTEEIIARFLDAIKQDAIKPKRSVGQFVRDVLTAGKRGLKEGGPLPRA